METSNRSIFESNQGNERNKTKSIENSSIKMDATSFLKFSGDGKIKEERNEKIIKGERNYGES
jgi:hypothetical protein